MTKNFNAMQWKVLDIEPTTDLLIIKRAYAQKLKVVRPDTDPLGFQELRAAYEWALKAVDQSPVKASLAHTIDLSMLAASNPTIPTYSAKHLFQKTQFFPNQQYQSQPVSIPRGVLVEKLWHSFIDKCAELIKTAEASTLKPIDDAVEIAKNHLTETLQQPELESLEIRARFCDVAMRYAAQQSSPPVIRLACLDIFHWEEERRTINFNQPDIPHLAINRALADKQYNFLVTRALQSKALRELLRPGGPNIKYRKLLNARFLAEMRDHIAYIRTSMLEVDYYRLDSDAIDRWKEIVDRPWPTPRGWMVAFAIGLITAIFIPNFLRDENIFSLNFLLSNDIVIHLLKLLILLFPIATLVIYPRYLYRPIQHCKLAIKKNQKLQLAWWGILLLILTFGILLNDLPRDYGKIFLTFVITYTAIDFLFRILTSLKDLLVILLFVIFSFQSLKNALQPFIGNNVFFLPGLTFSLFFSLRIITIAYGLDWHRIQTQLFFLGTGTILVIIQYLFASVFPTIAAIIGLWWILVASASADVFFIQLKADFKLEAFKCFMVCALIWSLPQSVSIDSPIAGMLQLQITFLVALVITIAFKLFSKSTLLTKKRLEPKL